MSNVSHVRLQRSQKKSESVHCVSDVDILSEFSKKNFVGILGPKPG